MIVVSGHSDDLIEVEGDIQEEFTATEENYLALSDGTVLRVLYTRRGRWLIEIEWPGRSSVSIRRATNSEDDYSDVVTVVEDIRWIVKGDAIARPKRGK